MLKAIPLSEIAPLEQATNIVTKNIIHIVFPDFKMESQKN
jgi:hypothetical protein